MSKRTLAVIGVVLVALVVVGGGLIPLLPGRGDNGGTSAPVLAGRLSDIGLADSRRMVIVAESEVQVVEPGARSYMYSGAGRIESYVIPRSVLDFRAVADPAAEAQDAPSADGSLLDARAFSSVRTPDQPFELPPLGAGAGIIAVAAAIVLFARRRPSGPGGAGNIGKPLALEPGRLS